MLKGVERPVMPTPWVSRFTTDANGVKAFTMPAADMAVFITPRTTGEFMHGVAVSGTTATVTFRKLKTAGLGITLGTLLTVSIFEDSPGVVNFDVECKPYT